MKMITPYKKMRDRNDKIVYVHRYLAQKKIGRPLKKTEIVHHLNGNKHDNRLSNLKVIDKDKHSLNHYRNGDYYTFKKKDQRKGALVTNKTYWKRK
jgi:hypothetical protein